MLKFLAIAVLAVSILPINAQQNGSQAGSDKKASQTKENPTLPAANKAQCVIKEDGTTIECDWPKSVPDGYLKRLFSAENAPNIALVVVGIFGVIAAILTLRKIKKQTDLMAGQLDEMQKSRDLENKTLILQYRPKIIVRNAQALQFSFELEEPWECEVRFQVVNTGGSPAYITPGSYIQLVSALGHNAGKIELKWGDRYQVSEVALEAGQSITVEEYFPAGVTFDLQWETFKQGVKADPLRYIIFTGVIYYDDSLNIPRSTGIHRNFEPKTGNFNPNKESEQEYSD
jgi:hypothetical protein